jgi:hypothetical protein
MAASAVTEAKPSTWALSPDVARQTQGIVASSFGWLPEGRALLLDATGARPGWLDALRAVAPVTDATLRARSERGDRAAAIAFTYSGLRALGLAPETLKSFSLPFREGMFQIDRARRLGDRRFGAWQPTVQAGGPDWSGNPGRTRRPAPPAPMPWTTPTTAPIRLRHPPHSPRMRSCCSMGRLTPTPRPGAKRLPLSSADTASRRSARSNSR